MKETISVLGIGRMGSALARAFLREGHATTVWNRTRSKCEPLEPQGARVAASVDEAVAASDVVVVNVADYGATRSLLSSSGVRDKLRGKLLVQLPSGSPREARELCAWAREGGVLYLDGAIMGTPNFIGTPGGTILYAGDRELFARYEPLLRALGGNPHHVGNDPGHASALDSALLVYLWGELFGVLQGAAICEAEELSLEAYLAFVRAFAPVVEGGVDDLIGRIRTRRFAADEHTLASLGAHHGAFQHLLELCAERGIDPTVPAAFGALFEAAMRRGHAEDDFAVLSEIVRPRRATA